MKINVLKKIFKFLNLKYTSYNQAFIISLFLTIVPFILIQIDYLNVNFLFYMIFLFCIVQVYVHIIFFLHLKKFYDSYLNLIFLIFTILISLIIISGSIWIMWNLNHYEKLH